MDWRMKVKHALLQPGLSPVNFRLALHESVITLHPWRRSPAPALLQIVPVQPLEAKRSALATMFWRTTTSLAGAAATRERAEMRMARECILK